MGVVTAKALAPTLRGRLSIARVTKTTPDLWNFGPNFENRRLGHTFLCNLNRSLSIRFFFCLLLKLDFCRSINSSLVRTSRMVISSSPKPVCGRFYGVCRVCFEASPVRPTEFESFDLYFRYKKKNIKITE